MNDRPVSGCLDDLMAHPGRGRALRPDGVVDRAVAVDCRHAADENRSGELCGIGIRGNRIRYDVRARCAVNETERVKNASNARVVDGPVGYDRLKYRLPVMARIAIIAGDRSPDYVSEAVELLNVVPGVKGADLVAQRDDQVPI